MRICLNLIHRLATDPYIFKITFECISQLEDDLEWKLIYVGSAQSKDYDQELDNCMVGPVPVGESSRHSPSSHPRSKWSGTHTFPLPSTTAFPFVALCSHLNRRLASPLHLGRTTTAGVNSFEFEGAAPSPDKIPAQDLLGVTVILLTASYKDAEFIRVGYYVHNFYEDEALRENPPETPDLKKVRREVLVSKPRVTRFNIKW